MSIKKIKEMVNILEESEVAEIEVKGVFGSVRVSRMSPGMGGPLVSAQVMAPLPVPVTPQTPATPALPGETEPEADAVSDDPSISKIESPMVGTFYRAPSPDLPSFVEEGQSVTKGAIVCIVEAMKVMNEIESDFAGSVVKIHVTNGEPVEYGQVLFSVKVQ
ncbi:MAG: acetyl-CoA carboxylase biotin carboxyl carrier protein [bacterium]|nr:acetyl-CoA carboxylase biotin carboxyl carrier protein [bacterium]